MPSTGYTWTGRPVCVGEPLSGLLHNAAGEPYPCPPGEHKVVIVRAGRQGQGDVRVAGVRVRDGVVREVLP